MGAVFHFDHHRREALTNRKRFSVVSAVLLMIILGGFGVVVKQFSFAASSTTFDLDGFKVDTSSSPSGPFQGATVQFLRSASGGNTSSTGNPYFFNSYVADSTGTGFVISVLDPTTYSGWSIKGSTYCSDCSSFNEQTANFATGSSRYFVFYPGHVYHMRWIWQYVAPTTPRLSGSVSGNTVNLSWTASTQEGGARILSYRTYNGSTQITNNANQSYSTTLSCSTSYAFTVKAQDEYYHYSALSNAFAGTTPPCQSAATPAPTAAPTATPRSATPAPTAAPKPAATPIPTSLATKPVVSTKSVSIAPKPGAAPTTQSSQATVDSTPPSVPEGFTAATSQGRNDVALTWVISSDTSGIKTYNLERSLDKSIWEEIGNPTESSYDDNSVGFNTHYYYRLTATDNAGNTSDYVYADATTSTYQANTGTNDAQLASDDGIASVTIPGDAIPNGASCNVVKGDARVGLVTGQTVVAGPYQILCKDSEGTQIAAFTKPLTWNYKFDNQLKGFGDPLAVSVDESGKAVKAKSTFNKKSKVIIFSQVTGSQTLVLASKKKGIPFNLIIGIMFFVAVAVAIILFFLRRGQQQNYSEYIRSKYYDI